jgi:hypothetical protein
MQKHMLYVIFCVSVYHNHSFKCANKGKRKKWDGGIF